MTQTDNRLGPADRAVYHLVEAGKVDAAHAPLYRPQLSRLRRAGLIQKAEDGGYAATFTLSDPPPARTPLPSEVPREALEELPTSTDHDPPSEPYHAVVRPPSEAPPPPWAISGGLRKTSRRPPMGKVVARVPQSLLDRLDEIGPTRSEALRTTLQRVLEKWR